MPYKDPEKAKQKAKERYERNKEEIKAYALQYYYEKAKHTEKHMKSYTIRNWKQRGLICNDFDALYDKHMSINNCQLCNVSFDQTIPNQRCMDHDHQTGMYRKTLCRRCNGSYKIRHVVNSNTNHKNIYKEQAKTYRYKRIHKGVKYDKSFNNITDSLCYKYIMTLRLKII